MLESRHRATISPACCGVVHYSWHVRTTHEAANMHLHAPKVHATRAGRAAPSVIAQRRCNVVWHKQINGVETKTKFVFTQQQQQKRSLWSSSFGCGRVCVALSRLESFGLTFTFSPVCARSSVRVFVRSQCTRIGRRSSPLYGNHHARKQPTQTRARAHTHTYTKHNHFWTNILLSRSPKQTSAQARTRAQFVWVFAPGLCGLFAELHHLSRHIFVASHIRYVRCICPVRAGAASSQSSASPSLPSSSPRKKCVLTTTILCSC